MTFFISISLCILLSDEMASMTARLLAEVRMLAMAAAGTTTIVVQAVHAAQVSPCGTLDGIELPNVLAWVCGELYKWQNRLWAQTDLSGLAGLKATHILPKHSSPPQPKARWVLSPENDALCRTEMMQGTWTLAGAWVELSSQTLTH